jgi:hypothetical protein
MSNEGHKCNRRHKCQLTVRQHPCHGQCVHTPISNQIPIKMLSWLKGESYSIHLCNSTSQIKNHLAGTSCSRLVKDALNRLRSRILSSCGAR